MEPRVHGYGMNLLLRVVPQDWLVFVYDQFSELCTSGHMMTYLLGHRRYCCHGYSLSVATVLLDILANNRCLFLVVRIPVKLIILYLCLLSSNCILIVAIDSDSCSSLPML